MSATVTFQNEEDQKMFERLKLMIQNRHPNRKQFMGELMVLLGVLLPSEARKQFSEW